MQRAIYLSFQCSLHKHACFTKTIKAVSTVALLPPLSIPKPEHATSRDMYAFTSSLLRAATNPDPLGLLGTGLQKRR